MIAAYLILGLASQPGPWFYTWGMGVSPIDKVSVYGGTAIQEIIEPDGGKMTVAGKEYDTYRHRTTLRLDSPVEQAGNLIDFIQPHTRNHPTIQLNKRYLFGVTTHGEPPGPEGTLAFRSDWAVETNASIIAGASPRATVWRTLCGLMLTEPESTAQQIFDKMPSPPGYIQPRSSLNPMTEDTQWLMDQVVDAPGLKRLTAVSHLVHWKYEGMNHEFLALLEALDSQVTIPEYLMQGLRADYAAGGFYPASVRLPAERVFELALTAKNACVTLQMLDVMRSVKHGQMLRFLDLFHHPDKRVRIRAAERVASIQRDASRSPSSVPENELEERIKQWEQYWREIYSVPPAN